MDIIKHVRSILPLPKSWEKDNDLRSFGLRINDAIRDIFAQRTAIHREIASSVSTTTATGKRVISIVLSPGEWLVTGKATFASNTTGARGIKVTTETAFRWADATASGLPISGAMTLNGTEYIKIGKETTIYLLAYQNSGGDLNVAVASLTAVRIRT